MYYSQFGEDEWLDKSGLLPKQGIYVDIGAGNPKIENNTYFLQEKGWKGLCIDGDPRTFRELLEQRDRCFFGVISDRGGFVPFFLHPTYPTLSSLTPFEGSKEVLSACFTIDDVLKSHEMWNEKVDLLSIDIEGHELDVLSISNYLWWSFPTIVIVEYNTNGTKREKETLNLFTANEYDLVHQTEANMIFRKKP